MARTGRRELVQEKIDLLKKVIEVLQEVVDNPDVSEKKIVENHGLDFAKYRRMCYDSKWFAKSSPLSATEDELVKEFNALQPTRSWYDRLWGAVMGDRFYAAKCPTDVVETFEYLFETQLNPREVEVIHFRYEECLPLEDIAKRFDVTAERVGQILNKATRKLKSANAWLINGKGEVINVLQLKRQFEQDIELTTRIQIVNQLSDTVKDLRTRIKEAALAVTDNKDDLALEDLGLSVHCYNRLHRAGINTVGDLRAMSRADIMRLYQFGPKDWAELEHTLTTLGIVLPEDDE
ncbi:MAG: hypothetical protein J5614_10010 [Paludibacteraceae bacterium]|nr:hypothetical protein [Paludibacteraceae bacterium]